LLNGSAIGPVAAVPNAEEHERTVGDGGAAELGQDAGGGRDSAAVAAAAAAAESAEVGDEDGDAPVAETPEAWAGCDTENPARAECGYSCAEIHSRSRSRSRTLQLQLQPQRFPSP